MVARRDPLRQRPMTPGGPTGTPSSETGCAGAPSGDGCVILTCTGQALPTGALALHPNGLDLPSPNGPTGHEHHDDPER
jgi:hypothetical protein